MIREYSPPVLTASCFEDHLGTISCFFGKTVVDNFQSGFVSGHGLFVCFCMSIVSVMVRGSAIL